MSGGGPSNTVLYDVNGNPLGSSALVSNVEQQGFGSSTQVWTSNGGTMLPTWQAAGGSSALTWIASVTASASATVDFANQLTSTYDNYLVTIENLTCASNSALQMVVGTGATPTWRAASYQGSITSQKTASGVYTVYGVGSGTTAANLTDTTAGSLMFASSNQITGGHVLITNINHATEQPYVSSIAYNGVDSVSGNHPLVSLAGGNFFGGFVLTSLRFQMSTGNITIGTFKLYGIQN